MTPLLIIPVTEEQPDPKSILMFLGKPTSGVTVTVAQAGRLPIGDVIPVGVEPEKLLSTDACVNTFSASEFKLSEIALSVLSSVVAAISVPDDGLVLLFFLHEYNVALIAMTAEAIIKFFSLI